MGRNFSDLTTRIQFLKMEPNEGFETGDTVTRIIYECWAGVDNVWMKDHEQAKANGTLEDLNIFIRNAHGTFAPTNKHSISILHPLYQGLNYNIKSVQPDLKDRRFIDIVVGRIS